MSGNESLIHIDVEEELQRIIQQLNSLPDQIAAPNILRNALNSTAHKVRKQMVTDVKGEYAIKNTKALRDVAQGGPKVLTASSANLSAAIRSRGPMQDIMSFMTRPNTQTGAAAAKILSSGSLKPLEMDDLKAFVTRFTSGHTAIVQRRGKSRLPVKKLLSPAIPHMLRNEAVMAQTETLAYETLHAEIDKRIAQVLGKA